MFPIDRIRSLKKRAAAVFREHRLPADARSEVKRDRRGLNYKDQGLEATVEGCIRWLHRAQDHSASNDGGLARDYSLISGWASSYPETTGYTIPTLLDYAARSGTSESRIRARRMLDWLAGIQMPCGAFQGGRIDSKPVVPVVFNTGQILLGLAAGEAVFGAYREPLLRAADWLVEVQDPDGCWRKHQSPFAAQGDKTYDTHTAWSLLEAARIEPNRGYGEAALANIQWALTHQRDNGWFDKCCLNDPSIPFTHTLGYVLRGVVEGYRFSQDPKLLEAACRTADGLLIALRRDGFLPGQLDADWASPVQWVCLTGTAQIAVCWLMLFKSTGNVQYRDAALAANRYLRRTVNLSGLSAARGGVKGSFPVDGLYNPYQYVSWAAKFLIDSLLLEYDLRTAHPGTGTRVNLQRAERCDESLLTDAHT